MSEYELISVDYLFHTVKAPQLDQELSLTTSKGICMCMCVFMCMCVCVCVCVCV